MAFELSMLKKQKAKAVVTDAQDVHYSLLHNKSEASNRPR